MAFWDSEESLAEVDKGPEKIFVKRVRKGERTYIDIRTFWSDDSGEWRPSKKGIAIPIELAPQIAEAVQKGVSADGAQL